MMIILHFKEKIGIFIPIIRILAEARGPEMAQIAQEMYSKPVL
jgi:hypothetical protein